MKHFMLPRALHHGSKVLGVFSLLFMAGCGPLISFGDDGPADQIFGLEHPAAPLTSADLGTIIYVEEPLMSDGLGGNQISVALEDSQRTSLSGVRWSANSTDLIRDYLVRGVSAASGVRMLGEGAIDVKAGCRLGLKVWAFEFVPGSSARDDSVVVEIEFVLVRYSDNGLIGQPTFRAAPGVSSSDGVGVTRAFNDAMQSVSEQAGAWLAPQAGQCAL